MSEYVSNEWFEQVVRKAHESGHILPLPADHGQPSLREIVDNFRAQYDELFAKLKAFEAEGGNLPAPELVSCDDNCGALEYPDTLEEYAATLEHYKEHPYLYGCSHGG